MATAIFINALNSAGLPTTHGRNIQVWLPFPDAEFGVQKRQRGNGLPPDASAWLIVHVKSTRLLPWPVPDYPTRREALVDARRLSVDCPHAAAVRVAADGRLTGDLRRLGNEVRAVFGVGPIEDRKQSADSQTTVPEVGA